MINVTLSAAASLPHTAKDTTELGGYTIPKGSTVFIATRVLALDPKIWGEDVEQFKPERWLDQDGKFQSRPEFIPFSIGE